MKWVQTKGMKPRTRAEKVFVQYRCGMVSKEAYPTDKQRWSWSGHDFDIVAYQIGADDAGESTWSPVSGGY